MPYQEGGGPERILLACVYLAGVDQEQHRKAVAELNNLYIAGDKKVYPESMGAMMTYLSHWSNGEMSVAGVTDGNGEPMSSFGQLDDVKCKKKGHYARSGLKRHTSE